MLVLSSFLIYQYPIKEKYQKQKNDKTEKADQEEKRNQMTALRFQMEVCV